jgi:hypothetical protein
MSAPLRIYQQLQAQIKRCAPELRLSSVRRLALLVAGIAASEHCTLRRVAREVRAMGLSAAQPESIARRLRRTVADERLDGGAGLAALLAEAITWPQSAPVVLLLDESSTPGGLHVLRLSLAYRGSGVPVAWAVWPHQQKLAVGEYWRRVDDVLDRAAALLPAGIGVVLLADRAYDVPPLLDRLRARNWDWVIRVKARSAMIWRDAAGEQPLRELVRAALDRPGRRVRRTGQTFKKAGWRDVQLVGEWGHGYREPLVVLTSLPPRWSVLGRYARRFWIEMAFRQDKSGGWDWAHSQVRQPAHQERLLLGLAWASLLVLSLGAQQAASALRHARHHPRRQPVHPRDSLFTLGLAQFRAWLYGTAHGHLPWRLPRLLAPGWSAQYQSVQLPQTVLP